MEDAVVEGDLERRTSGVVSRWQKRFYRIVGNDLEAYSSARSVGGGAPKRRWELLGTRSAITSPNDPRVVLLRPFGASEDADAPLELRAQDAATAGRWAAVLACFVGTAASDSALAAVAAAKAERDAAAAAAGDAVSFDAELFDDLGGPEGAAAAVTQAAAAGGAAGAGVAAKPGYHPAMTGYLWKRAISSGRNWKRRYFLLFDGRLAYAKDAASAGTPLGSVGLGAGSLVLARASHGGGESEGEGASPGGGSGEGSTSDVRHSFSLISTDGGGGISDDEGGARGGRQAGNAHASGPPGANAPPSPSPSSANVSRGGRGNRAPAATWKPEGGREAPVLSSPKGGGE